MATFYIQNADVDKECEWKALLQAKHITTVYPRENSMSNLKNQWCQKGNTPILKQNISELPQKVFADAQGLEYFHVDEKYMNEVTAQIKGLKLKTFKAEEEKRVEIVKNFGEFTKNFNMDIYVRTLPQENVLLAERENRRVFTDEIWRTIRVALERYEKPVWESKLQELKDKWTKPEGHLYQTFTFADFRQMIEIFGVDKKLLVVLDDPVHDYNYRRWNFFAETIMTYSPDAKEVTTRHQAVFKVFQDLVLGVNWERNGQEELENQIMTLMKGFLKLEEGTYIKISHIDSLIDAIKKEFPKQYAKSESMDYLFKKVPIVGNKTYCPHMVEVDPRRYIQMAACFDLTDYMYCWKPLDKFGKIRGSMSMWEHRMFIMFGWVKQFFERSSETQRIIKILTDNLIIMVDGELRQSSEEFVTGQLSERTAPKPWKARKAPRAEQTQEKPMEVDEPGPAPPTAAATAPAAPAPVPMEVAEPEDGFEKMFAAAMRKKRAAAAAKKN
ncbi:hypothetical protein CAEBREN_18675 [Caenorhabditis brenneri]|uniref:Uncharacterized protein n=1 Tax=Caenorhabditis brenneri TaxID=135651 RepID=G0NSB9_CAEBE|nr:hypothetical protein CAEBREN_18675 [Caenorhabditis brenneri]